jgi:hypothetical protein
MSQKCDLCGSGNRLNEATDIVTQHLTKSLVDLSGFGLASQGDSKFRFEHMERRFHVAALVVTLHEALTLAPFR